MNLFCLRPPVARRPSIWAILWAISCTGALYGQSPAGEIRLEVRDASGAPMQAAGKLENPAAKTDRSFATDTSGIYVFQDLPYGRYRLDVSRIGFTAPAITVEVRSSTPVSRIVTMALATATSRLDVIASTPLSGTDLTIDQFASPIQTATAADVENSGAADLPDFLNRRLNGVYVNETQANSFQPDVNFRGYTASPLLGTPEGISVYMDGVRQNQPFGDVVSWDLIPKSAISEITLMPGSDPLFGLNTLGGALSVQSKSGITDPGLGGNLTYGSSGRKAVQASYGGGKATGFNWFLTGNAFHESGWRVDSPSDIRQGFSRLGWRTDRTDLAFTLSYAYNTMLGNGLQDYRLIATSYDSDYSIADVTANRSPSFNFIGRHTFSSALTFSGNTWYRNIRTESINPNINDNSLDESVYQPNAGEQAALTAAGYTGFPTSGATAANTPFPKWRCIANAIQLNNPDERCNSIVIEAKDVQNEYGLSGQLSALNSSRAGRNQLTAGASMVRGNVNYTQNTHYGYLNPVRTITAVPAWQDGSTGVDSRVNLHGLTPNWSLFFTDTLTVASKLNITVSGRYNRLTVDNTDRIDPIPGPGSLTGNYVFARFNPAVGVTWSPVATLNVFASYTQGSRAPTSIELGCADPVNPCSLPNALASDPPLQQVVTGTWEVGLRGKPEFAFARNLSWSTSAFRAENRNDLQFISAPQTGAGYFQNFGKTRREGIEANLDGRFGHVTLGLDYTFLLATYRSIEVVNGTGNNTNDTALAGAPGLDGVISIHPGNRIPLVPKHSGKIFADFQIAPKFVFDLSEIVVSSSYLRGNENNAYQSDGKYYLGPGISPGYAITNFRAQYDLTRRLQLALQIDNLFDRHYYTTGQLAVTALTSQGTFVARPFPAYTSGSQSGNFPLQSAAFFTPGAPRRAWVELRLRF